ncbi:hypothetical protein, variant 2 [Blastomyces dermatitidis ER-3]|uniref:Uncharacterized protein n=1 Tax=Ajellomyces dermatitidis (strain ER-3 / ATCC MYA-2586) TaxID=559297 RepID=A0ABP2F3M3_AJEDR|nr:uncharacterized protein BDCG_05895 [Blastomyces dermatitidis ER-3]XP_045281446.1 hypothetical protein, variant 1 [Blastomyces dermatitidis ER-3]XP_045281447.1 hypothetical protein, variant 2 [Blastomyces dermatitidis ER-3]EEQ90775.1 hypothetical protein BDCG_05895 [Blastomyces dermatitidis ER-3]OAT01719.1 hypothetical protein, variant 1 [Blastomyces dermatitidis ER-3]OAT01720.1 hypothetical protein, variant 2 [Blastomyces dermatitidis ER-3]
MTWGTFPTGHETFWGPPNGGIPPNIMAPPPPAGFVITKGEDGKFTCDPRWASVSATTYKFSSDGKVVGNPASPMVALPSGPTPSGQAQAPHWFLPQQQIAGQFLQMSPAPVPAPAPVSVSAPGGASQPRPAPAVAPAGPSVPSQTQDPAAAPAPPAGRPGTAFAGLAPPSQVYAVLGTSFFTVVDAQGNLQVTLPGQHSAANLPPGFFQMMMMMRPP